MGSPWTPPPPSRSHFKSCLDIISLRVSPDPSFVADISKSLYNVARADAVFWGRSPAPAFGVLKSQVLPLASGSFPSMINWSISSKSFLLRGRPKNLCDSFGNLLTLSEIGNNGVEIVELLLLDLEPSFCDEGYIEIEDECYYETDISFKRTEL